MMNNTYKVLDVVQRAPNKQKLYDIIQKVYDLPNYGPCITSEYLQDILKPDSKYLKVKRSETHPIPKGTRKTFNAIETFSTLVVVLKDNNKKESGFTHYDMPNIEWMLRMIIWADPERKENIFHKQLKQKVNKRQQKLEMETVDIDPELKKAFDEQLPASRVTAKNYNLYCDSSKQQDQIFSENITRYIQERQIKAVKLKIQMERILQDKADAIKLKEIRKKEKELKREKQQMKLLKKRKRQESMQQIISGEDLQTPLVDKFFKLNIGNIFNNNEEIYQEEEKQEAIQPDFVPILPFPKVEQLIDISKVKKRGRKRKSTPKRRRKSTRRNKSSKKKQRESLELANNNDDKAMQIEK